jgi:hypothetical protein
VAALDFPSSPTVGQIYTANGKSWQWDGVSWNSRNTIVAAGSNTQIQYNNSGAFGASSSLTWNNSTSTFGTTNVSYTGTLTGGTGVIAIGTNQIYKDASGNVGIGTSSPGYKLDVAGTIRSNVSSNSYAFFVDNGTYSGGLIPSSATGGLILYNAVAQPLGFWTNNTERLRISGTGVVTVGSAISLDPTTANALVVNSSGNVGIGTSVNNVFDGIAAARPLLVQSASSATVVSTSTNALVICNSNTTTNNISQINFAAITGVSTSQYSSALISVIHGARVNGQYPTGQMVFSTSSATNSAPTEKVRIANTGVVTVGNPSTPAISLDPTTANALVVNSSGNVGIGTSSPGARLDVNGSFTCCGPSPQSSFTFNANGTGNLRTTSNWNFSNLNLVRNSANTATPRLLAFMLDGDSNSSTTIGEYPAIWGIYSSAPTTGSTSSGLSAKMGLASYAGFNFYINGTQSATLTAAGVWQLRSAISLDPTTANALVVNSSGNLLVGNTTSVDNSRVVSYNAGNRWCYEADAASQGGIYYYHVMYAGSTQTGRIQSSDGTNTQYLTTSDIRAKTNITPAGSAIQSVLNFPVDQFDWISTNEHQDFGAIAQKVHPIIPEMVSVPSDENDMWGIDWSKAVPRLIKTIQELSAKVTALEAKVN